MNYFSQRPRAQRTLQPDEPQRAKNHIKKETDEDHKQALAQSQEKKKLRGRDKKETVRYGSTSNRMYDSRHKNNAQHESRHPRKKAHSTSQEYANRNVRDDAQKSNRISGGDESLTYVGQKHQEGKNSEPHIPPDIKEASLPSDLARDLRTLEKTNAQAVKEHLLAADYFWDTDQERALQHARAAKNRAGRIASVRQITGLFAYSAGHWQEALSDLRTAHRMTGDSDLIIIIADCERGINRAKKAITLLQELDIPASDREKTIEKSLVLFGAYMDLGNKELAQKALDLPEKDQEPSEPFIRRLHYAMAELALETGDTQRACHLFGQISIFDDEDTDAYDRLCTLMEAQPENQ